LLETTTPRIFDVAAGHRLAISDDREGLQNRPGISGRALLLESVQIDLILQAGLKAPAAGRLHQLNTAPLPVFGKLDEQAPHQITTRILLEQAAQISHRNRRSSSQQGRFQHPL
jgi:hypothetical protein